jgi:hypothetical protein
MSKQLPAETIVCSEYQRLLDACVSAREIWKKHGAKIYRYRLVGKQTGDELLRLQADYARAYYALQLSFAKSLCTTLKGFPSHSRKPFGLGLQ